MSEVELEKIDDGIYLKKYKKRKPNERRKNVEKTYGLDGSDEQLRAFLQALVNQGKSSKAVAEFLGISVHTVNAWFSKLEIKRLSWGVNNNESNKRREATGSGAC